LCHIGSLTSKLACPKYPNLLIQSLEVQITIVWINLLHGCKLIESPGMVLATTKICALHCTRAEEENRNRKGKAKKKIGKRKMERWK
jgi:hypothetical protein